MGVCVLVFLYSVRKLSNVLPTYILKLIYYSIFHCHLTYCTHIWVNNYYSKMNVLRIAQNKIIRLIFKLKSRINTTSILILTKRLCLLTTLYSIKHVQLCIEYL